MLYVKCVKFHNTAQLYFLTFEIEVLYITTFLFEVLTGT